MPKISIPYESPEEKNTIEIDIPEENLIGVFAPKEPEPINLVHEVEKAIERPIEGRRFSELIGKDKKVVFIVENQFRAAPANEILPILVEKAEKAGSDISVLIANGKVPAPNEKEIKKKVGAEIVEKGIPIYCNEATNPERYKYIGTTSFGTPVWILKEVAEADHIVTISTTQATLWGYGGSGMIIPGVSSNETIEINHIMSLAPDCKPGNNDCKMQQDKYEALKLAGVDMGINVIVSNRGDPIYVNAGDPVESHKKAIEFYERIYKFDISNIEKSDIVITGTSAPTDHLFFHTGWAVVNCSPLTKEGGTIIHASPCPGYGDWPGFALMDLMSEFMPPSEENHERVLRAFFNRERELWAGCIWYPLYRVMLTKHVKVVTLKENLKAARAVGLEAYESIQEAVEDAFRLYGKKAKIAVVPYGRYTVFSE
ncbi:lactate racemase domain-containing protein [Thermococcus sp.]|uniref:lactate racemase domain-containing protein n=1 Tax=Thermococcus sp. TaxID=35749 RepID=UPI002634D065|nr:lactate racemase domain-containing protein [Thermococcus sp.]MCD6144198.1 DUF2088 domain-containing protein [Thermococcus sp.]